MNEVHYSVSENFIRSMAKEIAISRCERMHAYATIFYTMGMCFFMFSFSDKIPMFAAIEMLALGLACMVAFILGLKKFEKKKIVAEYQKWVDDLISDAEVRHEIDKLTEPRPL